MLVATVLAVAMLSGPQVAVIGNAAGQRDRPAERTQDANKPKAPSDPSTATEEVCREVAVTGSRFPRRVCQTRQQAQAEQEESRSMLRRVQGSRMPDGG